MIDIIYTMALEMVNNSKLYKNYKLVKLKDAYQLRYNNDVISNVGFFTYPEIDNFDWINIANVETRPKYRNQGLASYLLKQLLTDLDKKYPKMGCYLFVLSTNTAAIDLYKKHDFKVLKNYVLKDKDHFLMYRGNADIKQLQRMDYNLD